MFNQERAKGRKGWATLNELETNITITTTEEEEAARNSFIGGGSISKGRDMSEKFGERGYFTLDWSIGPESRADSKFTKRILNFLSNPKH